MSIFSEIFNNVHKKAIALRQAFSSEQLGKCWYTFFYFLISAPGCCYCCCISLRRLFWCEAATSITQISEAGDTHPQHLPGGETLFENYTSHPVFYMRLTYVG